MRLQFLRCHCHCRISLSYILWHSNEPECVPVMWCLSAWREGGKGIKRGDCRCTHSYTIHSDGYERHPVRNLRNGIPEGREVFGVQALWLRGGFSDGVL